VSLALRPRAGASEGRSSCRWARCRRAGHGRPQNTILARRKPRGAPSAALRRAAVGDARGPGLRQPCLTAECASSETTSALVSEPSPRRRGTWLGARASR
jgi:hypothetical protein